MNTAIRGLVTIVENYCDYYFGREYIWQMETRVD